ncbi:MAG: HAD family phosphatase [Candidatus Aminicenantes bacterium]|jgi:HAD superfamily hydrolase (TIGR01509 family)|nr:HAD family phosphatase [Candidatus Aminicenantes bacterium]MDH5383786.1 HAD family phosphatase [Candidatus Aminicenantes bacterium]MDH5743086.1 HAD family phosphatase [Candidatus Aminicenantes bacterium]
MIRCVLSDLGKVILFFDNHIFFRKMAEFCPYSAVDIAERVHWHRNLIRSFDTGTLSSKDFYREVTQRLKAKVDQETFFKIYNDVFSLNPPVLDILTRLKGRHKLLLLSNTDVERFGFIRKTFPEVLIFDEYVLSFEVGFLKPHPQIYQEALKKAKARAEECVFIDDLEENIEGARNVGLDTILYGPQTDLEAELRGKGL